MAKSIALTDICPMELGINILSGKWKLQILWNIHNAKTIRFNELQRKLGQITTKTLTDQLRELEEQQIIKRTVYPVVPPKVEYSFTEIGQTLEPVLKSLCAWGKQYSDFISLSRNILKDIGLHTVLVASDILALYFSIPCVISFASSIL